MRDFEVFPCGLNPYENDPGAWAASLLNSAEIVLGCLEEAGCRTVAEVGAYAGDLTKLLLIWAGRADARVIAVDPAPEPELEELEREHEELTLTRQTGLEAIAELDPLPDAIILDGDHNYFTLSSELAVIEQRSAAGAAADAGFPLVLLHDLCWPHGRRDDYFDPEAIPREHRQPLVPEGMLYPGIEGIHTGGLHYHWPAAREGGPRNGVLTAVEDFVASREHLALVIVPAFFGLGILFSREAAYAAELKGRWGPWDRDPLLARLERNRVLHLASANFQLQLAIKEQERAAGMERLLRAMLVSRAFRLAELWTRVRKPENPPFSRQQIRRALGS